MQRTITVSVIGVSGREAVKGSKGVGKSLICNRFVRGDFDNFFTEHCSVLSQTDFGGSPVINNDHWLYWGERQINLDESSGSVTIRVIEQTEFLDDETYEPIAGPSTSEPYAKRCCQIRLESRDKLMYIQKEQLGLEAEFDQHVLPDGKCSVDAFIFVFDASRTEGRTFESQCSSSSATLSNVIKTKKPIVLALSQMDSADDEARKALSSLLSRKDLKSTHITVVEVSALMNVNIDELFVVTACAALRSKLRLKVLPFSEAAKIVSDRNRDVQLAYTRLLQAMLPVESWPSVRLSWSRLMSERCLERQPDYCNFLRIYGEATAKKIYDSHVNEAREHWMAARLRALLPNLPRVFATLLDKTDVAQLSWSSANHLIHSHPLFDEFFQPLGQLGKQLDPLPADNERRMSQSTLIDQRIPAEILLRHEARQAFEAYKQALQTEQRKERLEEEFEFLLSDTPQVTPGKPLQDVSIFLQGYPAYDALPPSQAAMVYDRFQHDLLKRAEMEFRECLLENIEMFVDVVRSCREEFGSDAFPVPESEMLRIKDFLQDDFRYRQLSRLFELRDSLVRSFIMFLAQPGIHECPSFNGCAQLAIHEAIALFFQKKRMHKFSTSHVVDIAVHGEMAMVAQFITDMNVLLRNEPFATNYGPTTIRCYGADEVADEKSCDRTQLFLLDSVNSLDYAREYSKKGALASSTGTLGAADPLPPVYVLVCDPSHYDLLPYLHQQGIHLAESTYGIFIGAGSGDSDGGWSRASDCSSIFGRDQLLRICDTVCASQLDRRSGLRIQVSVLCGDPIPLDTMLVTMLGVEGQTLRAIRDPNQNGAGVVPVDVFWSGQRFAVDLHLGAYHSWLASKSKSSTHGHVVVYSARRAASFAHARAAISRVLDDGCRTLTGKAILLVAVAELQDYFSDEETNLLLTEGSELATSIGASFITIPPDASSQQSAELARFFERVRAMVPKTSTSERPMKKNSDFLNSDEYHHTGLRKDSSSMYGTYRTSHSAATLLSDSSASAESILSTSRMERVASAASAPALRNSISTISIGQNSAASRPRRRVAPLTSPLRLPIPNNISPACAPLATPEMIDIAPEYSLVQDALVDDEHIYATLDFSTKPSPKTNSSKEEKSASTKKEKKRPLRSRMFTNHSSTEPSTSPSTAPSQPSSAGSSMHREDIVTRKAPHQTNAEWRWLPISPNNHERRPKTAPLKPRVAPKPTNIPNPTMVCSMPPRSVTMDIINRESVVKARQILAHGALKKPGLRQSLSVESFVDLMGEKKKKFRFVRKVATSFRFKKPVDKDQPIEKTSQAAPPITSRSLPQSPQVERKPRKTAYLASSEKTSNAFSWLPSRSPKRTHKSTSEIFQGVVGPNDTLQTMAERDGGLPLFLTRCVDFIEKMISDETKEGGLEMEGLYRVPGNQAQLSELEKVFREKGDVDIASLDMPVHVVATAVKSFFSCLTEPLIPTELHDDILGCLNGSEETVERLHGVMSRLSPVNRKVLVYFTTHLEKVASSPSTAMDVHNLSKVLFPTLFRPQFNDFVEMSTGTAKFQLATEVILQNAHEIFNTYQAQSIRV